METSRRHRHRARMLTACVLVLLGGSAAAQESAVRSNPAEPRLGEPPRFSEGFELRTTTAEDDLGRADTLTPPLDGASPDGSQELGQDLRQLSNSRPPEPTTATNSPPLDLFAGPAVSRRENLPQERSDPRTAKPTGRSGPLKSKKPIAEADAAPASVALFRPIGPVRSPTFDDTSGRRLNSGLESLRRSLPVAADDPFAPVGTRVGSFVVYPAIEESVGVSSNLTNTVDGARGAFSQTTLSGRVLSDWSRHEAELNALATYRRNFNGPVEEEPQIDVDGRLRLDISREWIATLRGAFSFSRDDGLLTGLPLTAAHQADVLAYSGSAELSRSIGRASAGLTLEAVREDRSDGIFQGPAFDPSDSFSTYTAGLRAGYELSPGLGPFISASLGRRLFDDADAGGFSRDSVIPAIRAGVGFDLGAKLAGEIALGYAWNQPDEDEFDTTASPTIDAAITWSPRRGTNVLLKAATFFEPDASGFNTSTLYQATLGIHHRATARLDLEGQLTGTVRDGEDGVTERTYAAETGLTYWLNRQLALIARYRHDRFEGVLAGSDYDADTVRVGIRLQH